MGQGKTLGMIHNCPVKVGNKIYGTPMYVLEEFGGNNDFDLLLGLDFLERNRSIINLVDRSLQIHDEVIPFVEHEYLQSVSSLVRNLRCSMMKAYQAIKSGNGCIERAAEIIVGV